MLIVQFPKEIRALEQKAEGYVADIDRVKKHPKPGEDGFCPMEIEGTVHTEKKAAGSAILEACQAMKSPDPVPLGKYRGFDMTLHFDTVTREYKITLIGSLRHVVPLGTDVFGNLLRLDNALENLPMRLQATNEYVDSTRQQLEEAKAAVDKPFPFEEDLAAKSARLAELNAILDMDRPENAIVDGERSEDEAVPALEQNLER